MPVLLALVLLAAATPGASAEGWRRPVDGAAVRSFALGPSPYAAGWHRGVDLAARPGARVRSACSGIVRFAGRLPGGRGGVSVVCGGLVATHLDLASVAVRRGGRVERGAVLGAAAGPSVHLGARRLGLPHGYVDPLALLGHEGPPRLGPAPRPQRPLPAPPLAPARRPVASPRRASAPAPAAIPFPAWAGLALFAAGIPLGALVRRRRRTVLPRHRDAVTGI